MNQIANIARALRSSRFTHRALADGSGVVLDLNGSRVIALNPSGMFIVSAVLDGIDSENELVTALTEEFEVDANTALADIEDLLCKLAAELAPE